MKHNLLFLTLPLIIGFSDCENSTRELSNNDSDSLSDSVSPDDPSYFNRFAFVVNSKPAVYIDNRFVYLKPDSVVSFDVNANKLIYTCKNNNFKTIRLFDLVSKKTIEINNGKKEVFHPAFSPDGRWIAYNYYNVSYDWIPVIYNLSTGKKYSLTAGLNINYGGNPCFSPDGNYLVFQDLVYAYVLKINSDSSINLYKKINIEDFCTDDAWGFSSNCKVALSKDAEYLVFCAEEDIYDSLAFKSVNHIFYVNTDGAPQLNEIGIKDCTVVDFCVSYQNKIYLLAKNNSTGACSVYQKDFNNAEVKKYFDFNTTGVEKIAVTFMKK